jgi:hypothetical protein
MILRCNNDLKYFRLIILYNLSILPKSSGVLVVRLQILSIDVFGERRNFHTFSVRNMAGRWRNKTSSPILHAILLWI